MNNLTSNKKAHGTFIGSLRLEPNKPQQVFVDSELKFGASTRTYIVREKPQLNKHAINPSSILNSSALDSMNESGTDKDDSFSILTHLPESETEIDVIFNGLMSTLSSFKPTKRH